MFGGGKMVNKKSKNTNPGEINKKNNGLKIGKYIKKNKYSEFFC